MTRAGDRFGGRGSWRLGGDTLAASRVALDEAQQRATEALDARERAAAVLVTARAAVEQARRAEAEAAEVERRAVDELDGVERARARVDAERAQREVEVAAIRAEWSALHEQRADDVEHVAALEVRVPALEADAAEAQSLFESRALVQLELEERTTMVSSQRRELDLREAQVAERRRVLEHRLSEVDDRLARDPERRAEAERHRLALERRGTGYGAVGARLEALTARVDELLTRWRTARRVEAERAAAASGQLQEIRRERAEPSASCWSCASASSVARSRRPRTGCGSRPRSSASAPTSTASRRSRSTRPRPRCPRDDARRARPRPRPRAAAHGPDQPARARGVRRAARAPRLPPGSSSKT